MLSAFLFFQVFLILVGPIGRAGARSAADEPGAAAPLLAALVLVFVWTFRPFLAVCAAICWGWAVQKRVRGVLRRRE